jgi:hypothetical protein
MSFHSAVASILPSVPMLTDDNWFAWCKKMKMFLLGAGMAPVATGSGAPSDTKAKAEYNKVDGQLVAYIFTKVSEEHQYLVEDCDTGTAAWAALKKHFEKSTMGHRMAARREFYNINHDPSLPISQYIQAVTTARVKLTAYEVTVEDKEFIDVLLMNLHESYHHVRSSILMEATEPALDRIKNMLTGSAAATTDTTPIKVELANRAFGPGGRMGRSGGRPGAGQVGVSDVRPGRVDAKGYTWSDTTNSGGCHRCGRTGHIAARCMYNMPDHVKEWIMSSGTRSRSPSPPNHARAAMERASTAFTPMTAAWYIDEPVDPPFDRKPSPELQLWE